MFSVIVPIYNVEKYIDKCVTSILKQTYTNFELILVDDGSPDSCPVICDEYAKLDSRITVIHKPNGGVSSARNEGIKAAKGEYVWFVDSDDYVEENSLEILSTYIKDTDCDLYVFEREFYELYEVSDMDCLLRDHYFKYDFGFGPCNKIYKRELIIENELFFDREETVGEDLLFNIRYYSKMKSCLFVNEKLYHYVIRENSAMTTKDRERYKKQMRLFFKIRDLLESSISQEHLAVLFNMHLISGLSQSFEAGSLLERRKIAKEYLSKATFDKQVFKQSLKIFFDNEHSSFLGRCKIGFLLL